jgi:hypothetical protein
MSVLGLFRLLFERDPYKGAFGPVAKGRDPVVGGKLTWLPPYPCASLAEFLRGTGMPSALGIPKVYLTAQTCDREALSAEMTRRGGIFVNVGEYDVDFDFLWSDAFLPCQAVFTYRGNCGGLFHREGDHELTRLAADRQDWVVLACRSQQTLATVNAAAGRTTRMTHLQKLTMQHAQSKWDADTVVYATYHNLKYYGTVFDVRGMRILLYPQRADSAFSPDRRLDW